MTPPERSPERDAARDALVATVPFPGWTVAGLQQAAGPDADLLFPGGALDMVETWVDATDRRMPPAPEALGVAKRVRAVIAQRLADSAPYKEPIRRGLAVLALHRGAIARVTARTVDSIWHAAGDRSADWNWYTKRALLGGVYAATLLFWLRDDSDDSAATLAFLDRRLAGIGRIGSLRRRAEDALNRIRRPRAA